MSQYDTGYSDTTRTTTSGSMMSAFFDNRDDAQDAANKLRDLGIDTASIRMTEGNANSAQTAGQARHRGFFEALAEFFMPEEDRYTYAEGLNRGGYLVTVSNVPAGLYDQALDILDDEGAIDMDERADSWRNEGWTGYSSADGLATGTGVGTAATGTYTSGSLDSDELGSDRGLVADDRFATEDGIGADRAYETRMAKDSEAIPVVQEQLRVGKRDVSHGRVRVRSYMVEEPVEEQVNLRNERVVLERRPVDRPLSGTDAAFQDRTIEAEERAEEAVVSKEARVVEEVALRKEAEDRSETISDTVRHTEVEVEDERGNSISNNDRSRGRI